MKGNRIAVIVVIVLVAVIVGVVALKGRLFPSANTAGTIGAANRYTAQQITSADVVLKDAKVQAFMQSDVFHQLATNADFRRAVIENKTFITEMRNATAFDKLAAAMEDLKGKGPMQVSELAKGAATEDAHGRKGPMQVSELAKGAATEDAHGRKGPMQVSELAKGAVTEDAHGRKGPMQVSELAKGAATEDAHGRKGPMQVSELAKGAAQSAENARNAATEDARGRKFPGPIQISEYAVAVQGDAAVARLTPAQTEALFSVEGAKLLANPAFVELLNTPAFTEAARSGLAEALRVRGADKFATALTDLAHQYPDGLAALSTDAARNISRDAKFATLLDLLSQMPDNNVAKALADKDALAIMADAGFQRVENLTAFTEALRTYQGEMKALFSSDVDWGKVCQQQSE